MTDDLANRGPQDGKRIDVSQDHELRYWSHRFGVSQDALKRAVQKVGVMADDVERELTGKTTH